MIRISASAWAEIRTAYASGIGLRQLARNMGIPAGTVLARSKREGWSRQIATAKLIQRPALARELARPNAISAITPMQSAAISTQERKARLMDKSFRIANKAADRMETQIDTANISQATIAYGVATEKALLLHSDPALQTTLRLSIEPIDVITPFQKLVESLKASLESQPRPTLACREIISAANAETGS